MFFQYSISQNFLPAFIATVFQYIGMAFAGEVHCNGWILYETEIFFFGDRMTFHRTGRIVIIDFCMKMVEWAYCLITYIVHISISVANLLIGRSLIYGPLFAVTLSSHLRGQAKPSVSDWSLPSIILVHSSTFALRLHFYEQPPSGLSLALVHKHVKISVGKWLLETTRPHEHVKNFGKYWGDRW